MNVIIAEEQGGDETWCVATAPFKDLNELRGLHEQGKGITINRLEISDEMLYYDVDVDTLSVDSSFSTLTEITWSMTLPGAPMEHNADRVSENMLTWTPAPKSAIIHMRAESEVPRSGFSISPCGAAWIVMAVVLIKLRRRTGISSIP